MGPFTQYMWAFQQNITMYTESQHCLQRLNRLQNLCQYGGDLGMTKSGFFFKKTVINVLKVLMEKVGNISRTDE